MTEKASTYIKEIIQTETLKIRDTFSGPSYHAIQHILRRLDFVILFYTNPPGKTEQEVEELREFYNYGWAPALKPFYTDLNINTLQPFPEMYKEAMNWADGVIQFSVDITAYSLPIISEHSLPAFQCIVYQLEVGLKKIFQPKVYHSLVGYS